MMTEYSRSKFSRANLVNWKLGILMVAVFAVAGLVVWSMDINGTPDAEATALKITRIQFTVTIQNPTIRTELVRRVNCCPQNVHYDYREIDSTDPEARILLDVRTVTDSTGQTWFAVDVLRIWGDVHQIVLDISHDKM